MKNDRTTSEVIATTIKSGDILPKRKRKKKKKYKCKRCKGLVKVTDEFCPHCGGKFV